MNITLLDGQTYDVGDLKEKAKDDTFYYDFLGKYAFSSTSIKYLLKSPKTYKYIIEYGSEETQALRDGWLLHACILEPDVFNSQIYVNVQSKNTKKYNEAKAKYGKVFTIKEKNDAERLADALLRNEMVLQKLNNAEFEVPAIGEIMGFPFRAKADILGVNGLYDLKSTISLEGWEYSAKKYGYDIQCFIYCELFKVKPEDMGFVIIDKGSLDIGWAPANKSFYERGKIKVRAALDKYEEWLMQDADLDQYYIHIEL